MKKFIPYIFITAFIGAFLMISFSPSFSGTFSGTIMVEAQQTSNNQTDSTNVSGQKKPSVMKQIISNTGKWAGYAIGYGNYWGKGSITDDPVGHVISVIFEFFYYLTGRLLAMAAIFLDAIINFSVVNFKDNIENIGVINQGYKIILNVANMIFIFLLLYIAVKTILGDGGDIKKLLTKIIVVGLMINFSLFMTKVVIDASNIISIGFLNSIKTVSDDKGGVETGSIAASWISGLKLQTNNYNPNSEIVKNDSSKKLDYFSISLNFAGGIALNLVTAFVFFSASFLFLIRFIALLFYMLLSPIAFLGYISPELKEHSSKWWEGLQNQVIFAPAFLFIAYLVSRIINSGALWTAVGGDNNPANTTFYAAVQTGFVEGFPIVMNYLILIALMIGGLITAKTMANKGSAGMVGYAQKFQGWAQGMMGRNVVGRAAYLAGNNRYMAKLMAKSPTVGNFVKTQFDNVAGQKFGSKIGYEAALKKSIDKKKKMGEFVDKYSSKETAESIRKEERLLDEKNEFKREQMKKIYEAQKERDRLSDTANTSYNPADFVALSGFEQDTLQKEKDILKDTEHDIAKIKRNIDNLKTAQNNISRIANREYAKNIEFDSGILNKLFPSGADAAAEIRKGKKSAKKLMEEVLKETGELPKKEEGAEEKKEEKKEEKS